MSPSHRRRLRVRADSGHAWALPAYSLTQPGLLLGIDLLDREQIAELQGDNALA